MENPNVARVETLQRVSLRSTGWIMAISPSVRLKIATCGQIYDFAVRRQIANTKSTRLLASKMRPLIAWSRNDRYIAASATDGRVLVWPILTLDRLRTAVAERLNGVELSAEE